MQTRFGTGDLCHRYARPTDIEAITALLADPEVGRWLWDLPAALPTLHATLRARIDAQWQSLANGKPPDVAGFVIEDGGGAFVGQGTVHAVEGSAGGFELALQLTPAVWRRGIGTQAAEFLIAWAVHEHAAHRIQAGCLEGNAAAHALATKLGLAHEGTRPEFRLRGEQRRTELQFGSPVAKLDPTLLERAARAASFEP